MSDYQQLLDTHGRKCAKKLLDGKEAFLDEHLPDDVAAQYRKMILDYVGDYTRIAQLIADAADHGQTINELAIRAYQEAPHLWPERGCHAGTGR